MNNTISLKIENAPLTLREIALNKMRHAIISGYFEAGERLVERSLCEELNVSRSIVREVIRYLEAEGLIEILPKKGPIVSTLNWHQAEQIYNIRTLLEQSAAFDCAKKADDSVKKILHRHLLEIKKATSDAELIEASVAFYETLFLAADQTIAWEIVQRLNSRISRLRVLTLKTKKRAVSGFERMKRIYNAIVENNANEAKQAVTDHLLEVSAIAKTILEDKEK